MKTLGEHPATNFWRNGGQNGNGTDSASNTRRVNVHFAKLAALNEILRPVPNDKVKSIHAWLRLDGIREHAGYRAAELVKLDLLRGTANQSTRFQQSCTQDRAGRRGPASWRLN